MHTPAHAVLNLTVLGRHRQSGYLIPVLIGSLLPDVPMFIFYFVERFVLATPMPTIWRVSYFEPGWQAFIDTFNSVPFMLMALWVAWRLRNQFMILLMLSMLLHVACDLPLHHDDGHRHLFPFLDWRFESPVSYWDPRYFGRIASGIEALLVLACCWVLYIRHVHRWTRVSIGAVAGLQVAEFGLGYRFYL